MKKIYLSMLFAAGSIFTQAQVGVNQDDPKATLDVVAKTDNTSDKVEGLLIPRVDKAKALKMVSNDALQESTMIYVNVIDASTGTAVADITETGYYFYNGTKWVKVAGSANGNSGSTGVSDNIYTADGTLSSNRTVNTNGKNLVFTGTGKVGIGMPSGYQPTHRLELVGSDVSLTSTTSALMIGTYDGANIAMDNNEIMARNNGATSVLALQADGGDLSIWNNLSDASKKVRFTDGKLGIGTTSPIAKLQVTNGSSVFQSTASGEATYVMSSSGVAGVGGLIHTQKLPNSVGSGFKEFTTGTGTVGSGRWRLNFISDLSTPDVLSANDALTVEGNAVGINLPNGQSPTEKLEVNGSIKSTALAGTGTRNVVADANGKLIIGDAGSSSGTLEITNDVKVVPNTTPPTNGQPLHANGLSDQPAEGTNLRNYNGTSVPDYAASDYMIVLTNTGVNGKLELPSAAANPGRIIYLINGTTSGLGFSGLNADGTSDIYPFNFTTITTRAGVGFVSTGKTWYTIGR